MFSKYFYITVLLCSPFFIGAQVCSLTLSGHVLDTETLRPLEFVNLLIKETGGGVLTDSNGFFKIENLCPEDYHILFSHIGCEPKTHFIQLTKDSTLRLTMNHSLQQLNEVVIKGESSQFSNQIKESISKQEIEDNAADNLSAMLERVAGVSSIKNGSGISKPVVHGLYGNRLTILNNGVPQSGQQWGNDHSPEIDPLVANKISVIKGAAALEHIGGSLGAIIDVAPKKIENEPHLHGSLGYFFESNGRSHGVHLQAQKHAPLLAWKIKSTLKKSGDKRAPDYFLNNTGNQEANVALQLEKSFDDRLFIDLYASTFNTVLGVLRGSHISNLTDLEEALNRTTPFFTEDEFSYVIDAPKQKVNHHLIKLRTKRLFNDSESLAFTLAGQLNNRKEFDVRRSGRSDIPALSLQQYTLSTDLKYQKVIGKEWTLKTGAQYNFTDNSNNPETGILPLIPDYISNESGLYVLLAKPWTTSHVDFGIRYDNAVQNVVAISNSVPREIIRYKNNYNNINASIGYTKTLAQNHRLTANVGYAMRNPGINELYSAGLHQGVSGIEEGDINLQTEKAIKSTIEHSVNITPSVSIVTLLYYQRFNHYIYLKPQDEIRLTIRGAFPVFKYDQTNAELYGLDLSTRILLSDYLYSDIKFSYIKGQDRTNDLPLINIPSNDIYASLVYQFKKPISVWNKNLNNIEIGINNRYVFKQNNLQLSQDYVVAPDGYNLLSLKLSADIPLQELVLRFIAKIDNVANIRYRDYLNRQRYFADDVGINFTFGLMAKF